MLIDLVKISWKALIFIAIVSLVTTWAFNISNTMIVKTTISATNVTIYTFSMQAYLQNLNNAWTSNALQFEDILPTRQYQAAPTGNPLTAEYWETLWNNMALTFDWVYFPINFGLWLFRWICWLLRILLAIIGWNTQIVNGSYASTLVRLLDWNMENLFIPYL